MEVARTARLTGIDGGVKARPPALPLPLVPVFAFEREDRFPGALDDERQEPGTQERKGFLRLAKLGLHAGGADQADNKNDTNQKSKLSQGNIPAVEEHAGLPPTRSVPR